MEVLEEDGCMFRRAAIGIGGMSVVVREELLAGSAENERLVSMLSGVGGELRLDLVVVASVGEDDDEHAKGDEEEVEMTVVEEEEDGKGKISPEVCKRVVVQ